MAEQRYTPVPGMGRDIGDRNSGYGQYYGEPNAGELCFNLELLDSCPSYMSTVYVCMSSDLLKKWCRDKAEMSSGGSVRLEVSDSVSDQIQLFI